jgi:hypothetical protein
MRVRVHSLVAALTATPEKMKHAFVLDAARLAPRNAEGNGNAPLW